jgi:hypothetical protein
MKFTYKSHPRSAILDDIEYSNLLQSPERRRKYFSVIHNKKAPQRTFVKDASIPATQGWKGQYDPNFNTLDVVVKETPRIVKHPSQVSHTLAHEYDHWA